jgi:hypothetical protein
MSSGYMLFKSSMPRIWHVTGKEIKDEGLEEWLKWHAWQHEALSSNPSTAKKKRNQPGASGSRL